MISAFLLYTLSLIYTPATHQAFRHILVFTSHAHPEKYLHQLTLLDRDMEGVQEREIRIRIITDDLKACTEFRVKTGVFCILLIGKDGMEKFRSLEPVSLETLFSLIDAMPLRKEEIKRQK